MDNDDVSLVMEDAAGWRVAFARGFLAGDNNGVALDTAWGYRVGWRAGRIFRSLRARI